MERSFLLHIDTLLFSLQLLDHQNHQEQ
ncbi:hypothetical protein Mgra_00001343 [Meloidogyne graminicola]|uniref:Uncharacterized protein n=1 Tax=Meloidogyne graminicola TaxID=189291 RepID=A0A8T0A0N3_9BILA|nr:hypothetical protein Mgra_00001343 [Meloidogyne graminicola]